ncbi:MAG: UDP-N-acetylmuramate--L-alanine ligase [Lachnospirales bacterium]
MEILNYNKFYFMGIGGVSMSGFALLFKEMGYNVSGFDMARSDNTDFLEKNGIKVFFEPSIEHITNDVDCIVYSSAISDDFLELAYGKSQGIHCINRGEMIGEVLKKYEKPLCISGTHGKTTTTALVATMLLCANENPTISVGGHLPIIDGVFKIGNNKFFVLESCEYKNNFLNFGASTALIMNIEMDHSDFFKDLDEIYTTFNNFAKNASEKVIINMDIKNYLEVLQDVKTDIVTYSLYNEDAKYYVKNIEYSSAGTNFDLFKDGEKLESFNSKLLGEHNLYNSLSALVTVLENDIDVKYCKKGLLEFTGINRRFQYKGIKDGIVVYDDYAHHPTACKKTLETFLNLKKKDIYCIFQPHTYSRTISLLDEFASSFKDVSKVLLLDIYAAREQDLGVVSSKLLAEKINEYSNNAIYFKDKLECINFLKETAQKDDIIITLGAGDVYRLGEEFLKE